MDKLVVSSEEVASVAEVVPSDLAAPKLPRAISWVGQLMLAPLVLVLPLLCVATAGIWLGTRRKEPRVRYAWAQYCCLLLVISGLIASVATGLFFFLSMAPVHPAAAPVPFALDSPLQLPAPSSEKPLSPSELAGRMENNIFIVTKDSKWFKPSREALALNGFGTGVLIFAGDGQFLLATARHVLDGEKWESSSPYTGDAILWDRHGGYSRAKIVGRHKHLDLMLLQMPRVAGKSAFAQPILDFEKIAPGEHIVLFGHPEGLFFSLSDGLVSRKDPSGLLQITAPVSPGASGGPVYDLHGHLLGIVSSMLSKRATPDAENLNFAVRADCFVHSDQWNFAPGTAETLEKFISAGTAAPAAASANSDTTSTPVFHL